MATKVWKGFLNFGLLSIPIYLNVAARDKRIELNTFHSACDSQIRMPKYCPTCQVQLQPTETYRGYKASDSSIIKLTDEEMDSITPETEKIMTISEIVEWKQVDPIFLADSFYLLPDDAGLKAYSLLVRTLKETGRVAIAQLTKSSREHVVAIRPKDNGLMVHYIWYENEIAKVPEFENLKLADVSAAEMKLAKQLTDSLQSDFDHSQYEDSYIMRLNTLIASKTDKAIKAPTPVKTVAKASIDIMAALQASMAAPKKPHRAIKLQEEPAIAATPAKGKKKKVA